MYYGSTEDALTRFGKIRRSGSIAENERISIHVAIDGIGGIMGAGSLHTFGSIWHAGSLQHFGSVSSKVRRFRLVWKTPCFVIGAIVRLAHIESSGPLLRSGCIWIHSALRSVGVSSGL